jgi:cohesin loading factor subunit SCC2
MTMERSSTIMDAIFASPEEEGRGRLLKIMQEFLISEASKHSVKEKGKFLLNLPRPFIHSPLEITKGKAKQTDVNMDELVGNTDGFADSGFEYLRYSVDMVLTLHIELVQRLYSGILGRF